MLSSAKVQYGQAQSWQTNCYLCIMLGQQNALHHIWAAGGPVMAEGNF